MVCTYLSIQVIGLHGRKSGLIDGIQEDAGPIAAVIAERLTPILKMS